MGQTFIRQDIQIFKSDTYSGVLLPGATLESASANLEDDLNALRSQVHNLLKLQGGNWYDDLATPITFENGAKRGVDAVNQDLHDLERKRVLVMADKFLVDITVPAAQNWVVLGTGELPQNTTAAIGSVSTRGTVSAYNASFDAHSLALVTGSSAISPKNLCEIVDSVTHDPVLSAGRRIYALFQTESNTDGSTITTTTPNRGQLSFVRLNALGTALEAVPVSDIENKIVHYAVAERKALEDLTEQDFLRGAVTDVPASATVTRQVAYDNQGTTPVELTTNATLDLNSAGIAWKIRDLLDADLLSIVEGSGGGTSTVQLGTDVDTFDVNAIVNDFDTGIRAATGSQRIDIGVNPGIIESTGANDLRVLGANELYLDDTHQTGSTWAQTQGIKLSGSTAEWNAFETKFGETSLLDAIVQAANSVTRSKTYANVTTAVNAGVDVGGVGGGANLDAQLPDMSTGAFLTDYDVYLNGQLQRPGANVGANMDYYPGTSLADGQIKLNSPKKLRSGDVLCVITWV